MHKSARYLTTQGGLSLVGLIFMLAILGFLGVLGLRIAPTVIEYRAISNAIVTAKSAGGTVREIQNSFDKSASVGYIDSISGRDLIVSKDSADGSGLEVSFAYEKKIALFGPASLVLDYTGSTAKGVPVAKAAE